MDEKTGKVMAQNFKKAALPFNKMNGYYSLFNFLFNKNKS